MYLSRVFNLMLIFFYVCASRLPIISNILSGEKRCWDGERIPLNMGKGRNHLSSFGGWRTNNFHLCSLFYSFSFIGTGVCMFCCGTEQCKKTQHGNPSDFTPKQSSIQVGEDMKESRRAFDCSRVLCSHDFHQKTYNDDDDEWEKSINNKSFLFRWNLSDKKRGAVSVCADHSRYPLLFSPSFMWILCAEFEENV